MAVVSKTTIEEIKARCDIVDIIGAYLPLKKAGSAYKGLCPFHKEKTPSFTVNQARQIFHCFGCQEGGDVFSFVMTYENVDFTTALSLLAQKAGVALEFSETQQRDRTNKDQLYKVLSKVADLYHQTLLHDDIAKETRAYIVSRDLSDDLVSTFQLGFARSESKSLINWARKEKVSTELLESAGLIGKGERGDAYDRFRNRLMFPICDELGRVIGFSGRIMDPDASPAKYVNSPETLLFKKSRILYGLDKAKQEMVDKRHAILCEGQIDVIRCHAAGVQHAVAPQGTALTEDHARLLKRYADLVTLVFDADTAGKKAALRSAGVILAAGLSVKLVELPEGEDPDSLIRGEGPEAFIGLVDNAKSVIDFLVDHLQKQPDSDSEVGIRRIAREVLEMTKSAPSEIQRDQMIQQAGQRLGISEHALRSDLKQLSRQRYTSSDEKPPPVAAPVSHPVEEVALLELLLHHPETGELVFHFVHGKDLADSDCRLLFELIETHQGDPGALATETLASGRPECARLAAELLAQSRIGGSSGETSPEEGAQGLILRIRRKGLEQRRQELRGRLAKAADEEKAQLQRMCSELTLDIKTLQQGWERALHILDL